MLKNLIALFSLFLILMACSSSEKAIPFTPSPDFDASEYINPEDYGVDATVQAAINFQKTENFSGGYKFERAEIIGNLVKIYENISYPRQARNKKIGGQIKGKLFIDADGKVQNIEIIESDYRAFTTAFIEAVSKTEFRPARINKEKVKSILIIPVRFMVQTN